MPVFSPSRFLLISVLLFFSTPGFTQFSLVGLKTEYQETPLGIDVKTPVFSWQMKAGENLRGQKQTIYQVLVKDEAGITAWNSGKHTDPNSVGISYKGQALKAATKYAWSVTVWNQDGKSTTASSWFETGLLNPDANLSAWSGANWIGGTSNDMVFYSHYLTVFKFQYNIQLDEKSKSTKAAFIFGANDERLMNRNLNTKGMLSKKDSSYIKAELDISQVDGSDKGRGKLHIYRVGYVKTDSKTVPFKTLDIPLQLINQNNKYQQHSIHGSSVFGVFDLYIDGEDASHAITLNDQKQPSSINLNPVGWGADYIAYPIVGDIGFALDKGQKAYFSDVTIKNNRSPSNTLFKEDLSKTNYNGIFKSLGANLISVNDGKYLLDGTKNSLHLVANPTQNATPMLRAEFKTEDKGIKKARLYATARGIYELYLNGNRVSAEYFNPGLTQYDKTHLYQTFDVTTMLSKGAINACGAILSEGWWSGNITYTGGNWNFFGDRQSLLAKLIITYDDGTEQVIVTNPDKWKYFNDGPIRYGSFFQGEVYDASKEQMVEGWAKPGFDDSKWHNSQVIGLDSTSSKVSTNAQGQEIKLDFSKMQLLGMPGVTGHILKTLKPSSVQEVRPGVFIYDMGQNMVGFAKIKLQGVSKGDTVMVRYAEIKYPDLEQYRDNKGMLMLENLRAAMVRDIYICKGANDVMQPRFTSHGFRYLEITNIKKAIPLANITGLVLSSVTKITAGFESSNLLVNQLWSNIIWSTVSNFLLIPTDTPARNERMGWSGDISVFSKTATYLTDLSPFLKRHMLAMRDLQYNNGRFTDTAPVTDAFGGVLWGSAGIVVTWESYQQYKDLGLLVENYDAMKRYVAFLKTRIDAKTGMLDEGPLGDWLSPENYKNDDTILWDAYYLYDLDVMRQVAKLLGKADDGATFEKEFKERKALFNKLHIDQVTGKTIHSGHRFPWGYQISNEQLPAKGAFSDAQASYAVPLAFNVIDPSSVSKSAAQLVNTIKRKNKGEDGVIRPEYSLMTGFIGTAAISNALSMNGYDAEAYKLLQQTSYPSWLYSVKNGATSIWERLNSYTVEDGFGTNNSMNSFNHYSFGAVGAWMINYSIGIARDEAGFGKFILQPTPDPTGQMKFAKGFYDSMYGRITSEWKTADKQTEYNFDVPANTTATLYLIGTDVTNVTESGIKIKGTGNVSYVGKKDKKLVFKVKSGTYRFIVKS